jgi:ubiquinone/menaquinone biosynthesis C-methylase UbiE
MNDEMYSKELEINFFNTYYESGYDVFQEKTYRKVIGYILKLLPNVNNKVLLEIGCGSGAFTKYLSNLNFNKIYAIDISSKLIEYAKRKKYKNVEFFVCDAEEICFIKDSSIDIVVCFAVLHHFPNREKVLKEIKRVLRPEGVLFAFEPNRLNPIMWLYRDPSSPFYSSIGVTPNERPILKKEIEQELKLVGFNKIKIFAVSGIEYKFVKDKKFGWLLKFYNLWERIFDKIFLSKIFGSFLIIFAKK